MAKKTVTTTEFTDDLDGGPALGTVTFSYDGTNYEIDLSKKNKTAMDKTFKTYIEHARKVRTTRRGSSATTANRRRDLAGVRVWAAEQGIEVSERGRISKDVLDKYDAAH